MKFLRFNPDGFKLNGKRQDVLMKARLLLLAEVIRKSLECIPTNQFSITRLYFDSSFDSVREDFEVTFPAGEFTTTKVE